jgi:hypothetical protein
MITFRDIKVSELEKFIESDLYQNAELLPITPMRAHSQACNPRAEANDTALLLALDDSNKIIGYIGCLPEKIPSCPKLKIAWNSCWYADPEKGKAAAMPLFFKFMTAYPDGIMMRDLTETTKRIILATNRFSIAKKLNGTRYFLLTDLGKRYSRKLNKFKIVLVSTDYLINSALRICRKFIYSKPRPFNTVQLSSIDKEAYDFIENHNQSELFKRSADEINHIVKNPWVLDKRGRNSTLYKNYYFSSTKENFSNFLVKLTSQKENQVIAILFFSAIDNHFRLPYFWYTKKSESEVFHYITHFLIENRALSFLTFHDNLSDFLDKKHLFYILKRKFTKEFVVSKTLSQKLPEKFDFQDGEGDFVYV